MLENIVFGSFQPPTQNSDLVVMAMVAEKSSVLELASLALSNMWSLAYTLNRTAPQSSFEVTIGLLPSELALIDVAMGTTIGDEDVAALVKGTMSRGALTKSPSDYLLTR